VSQVNTENLKIAVIGLGYVGLPLAIELARKFEVFGFDVSSKRVQELLLGKDSTNEVGKEGLLERQNLHFSCIPDVLRDCNFYIIGVPTPVDEMNNPDLTALMDATKMVGQYLTSGNVVVFESTVFPGATEEICLPILEGVSGLKCDNTDNVLKSDVFSIGFSPERINPGDKQRKLTDVVKVVSGSSSVALDMIDFVYSSVISAGTYRAKSIKIAEAAKVIENIQRDINIALVNELAVIFEKLDIRTSDVLEAAGTKWNFLKFEPGLVGGHCIGVDPYYLAFKAQQVGYYPEMILAGRRINNKMGTYCVKRFLKMLARKKINLVDSNVLIFGITFKENCRDMRNSKVLDIIKELHEFGISVDVYDPLVEMSDFPKYSGVELVSYPKKGSYEGLIVAVAHDEFRMLSEQEVASFLKPRHVVFDLKSVYGQDLVDDYL
jgi:UDP-N-acetyl-D-galactosamine dehydrogenase